MSTDAFRFKEPQNLNLFSFFLHQILHSSNDEQETITSQESKITTSICGLALVWCSLIKSMKFIPHAPTNFSFNLVHLKISLSHAAMCH